MVGNKGEGDPWNEINVMFGLVDKEVGNYSGHTG
jgi:hypothetical protein